MGTGVYAEERQRVILQRVRKNGRVEAVEMAEEFAVSMVTIRRDLSLLERLGLLKRVYGGAIQMEPDIVPSAGQQPAMLPEKRRIAQAALAELPPAGSILLDAGTTTAQLAEILPADLELTVVTPSAQIALMLVDHPNLTVMLTGGRLRRHNFAGVDEWAVRCLHDTFVEIAFVVPEGFSVEHGLTTRDSAEAMVKRAVVASARRTVVLADHTKFGNDKFARFADLSDVDVLITDGGIDPVAVEKIATIIPEVSTI